MDKDLVNKINIDLCQNCQNNLCYLISFGEWPSTQEREDCKVDKKDPCILKRMKELNAGQFYSLAYGVLETNSLWRRKQNRL